MHDLKKVGKLSSNLGEIHSDPVLIRSQSATRNPSDLDMQFFQPTRNILIPIAELRISHFMATKRFIPLSLALLTHSVKIDQGILGMP